MTETGTCCKPIDLGFYCNRLSGHSGDCKFAYPPPIHPQVRRAFAFTDEEIADALHEIHDAAGRLFTANWRSEELLLAKRIAGWARILEIGIEERQQEAK